MSILESLHYVKGAVSNKDFQPALRHFRIKDGRVMGYNGTIALSAPIDCDLEATPQAIPFYKAVERCVSTTALWLTPAGKLGVKSAAFKALIECIDDSEVLDAIVPDGEEVHLKGNLLKGLKKLQPLIGVDASPDRTWTNGILLKGQSAFATNNIILAEYWLEADMPEVNLPAAAVAEIVRIGEEPSSVRMSPTSMTFFYADGRWMRTQLLNAEWPSIIHDWLDRTGQEAEFAPFPDGFFDGVETLRLFTADDGRIFFRGSYMTTAIAEEAPGATVELEGLPAKGAFHYKHLQQLDGVAREIDFSKSPAPFRAKNLRGLIQPMIDA